MPAAHISPPLLILMSIKCLLTSANVFMMGLMLCCVSSASKCHRLLCQQHLYVGSVGCSEGGPVLSCGGQPGRVHRRRLFLWAHLRLCRLMEGGYSRGGPTTSPRCTLCNAAPEACLSPSDVQQAGRKNDAARCQAHVNECLVTGTSDIQSVARSDEKPDGAPRHGTEPQPETH
jgi:hypothetical protein